MTPFAVTCDPDDGGCGFDGGVTADTTGPSEGPTTCPWCGRSLAHDDVTRVDRGSTSARSPTGVPLPAVPGGRRE